MKKIILPYLFLITFYVLFSSTLIAGVDLNKSKNSNASQMPIKSEAGLNIPEWGVAIDASFDPRLTDLILGYHIVTIMITNRRNSDLILDSKNDVWFIVDSFGKKRKAKNHVQYFNKKLWANLPIKLKEKLHYPAQIKSGQMVPIDVFLPKSIDLFQFKEIIWKSASLQKEFSILTAYENSLNANDKGIDLKNELPVNQRPTPYLNSDYLKTREEILNNNRSKWDKQEEENQEKPRVKPGYEFEPDFDDAIIIR